MTTSDDYSTVMDYAKDPINSSLTADEKIALLTQMIRIRRFEQAGLKSYQSGKIGGFLHLYIGQEAVAVGTISIKGPDDHYITAYRDHGHALALGMNMNECMAEMFGKQTGCSKGKGGSMHFFAPDKNFWGGHGIVAGQTPLGLGLAYGVKYLNRKGSCFCFLGDGAVNQGAFHEVLNIAGLMDIPVVFVIENNGYSMGTSQKRSSSYGRCLAERAEAYGMAWDVVDGSNLYEVRAKSHVAMQRAHNECKPTLLEIDTYRYYGHSIADANHKKYRTPEEIENYKQNFDPINVFRNTLMKEGVLTEEIATAITKAATEEAAAAVRFADESPAPTIADISTDVYWESDHQTPASKIGYHFFND